VPLSQYKALINGCFEVKLHCNQNIRTQAMMAIRKM